MVRKGITPVVSIVLLLMITVGATGVVYTQFEEITDQNPQEELDYLNEIDVVVLDSITESGDDMQITIEHNQEDQDLNLSKSARLMYSIDGQSKVNPDQVTSVASSLGHSSITYDDTNDGCTYDSNTNPNLNNADFGDFSYRDSVTCSTGVEMPPANVPIEVYLVETGSGKTIDSTTCLRTSSDDVTC